MRIENIETKKRDNLMKVSLFCFYVVWGLFPLDYFIVPMVKCIMFIIRTLTICFTHLLSILVSKTGVKNIIFDMCK